MLYDAVVGDESVRWLDHFTVMTERGVKVHSYQLESVVLAQSEGELREPESGYVARLLGAPSKSRPAVEPPAPRPERAARPERTPRERTPRTPRTPRAEGLVTLAELCEQIGMDPKDARGLLRRGPFTKGSSGWAWSEGEAREVGKWLEKKL